MNSWPVVGAVPQVDHSGIVSDHSTPQPSFPAELDRESLSGFRNDFPAHLDADDFVIRPADETR